MSEYKTQCDYVLEYLENNGTITSFECIKNLGITRLSARIADLKERGHIITGETVTSKNRAGRSVHYTRYTYRGKKPC